MSHPTSPSHENSGGLAGKAGKTLLFVGLGAALRYLCEKAGHSLSPVEITSIATATTAAAAYAIDAVKDLGGDLLGDRLNQALFEKDQAHPTSTGLNHDIERVLARAAARSLSELMKEWKALPSSRRDLTQDDHREINSLVEACEKFFQNDANAAMPERIAEWVGVLNRAHILEHAGLMAPPSAPSESALPSPCKFSEYFNYYFPERFKSEFAEEYARDAVAQAKFDLVRDAAMFERLEKLHTQGGETLKEVKEVKHILKQNLHARHTAYRRPFQIPPGATVGHLFGRTAELDKLVTRLRQRQHTDVWGPAGMGKTALVSEALRVVVGESIDAFADSPFPDGVVLLDLYRLKAHAETVWSELAIAFDPYQPEDLTPGERARRACNGRKALVIVEGAEEADPNMPGRSTLAILLAVLDPQTTRLILTRNEGQTTHPNRIAVTEALGKSDALALLKKADPRIADSISDGVYGCLGGHPLALTWAGCQLADADEAPGDFLRELRKSGLPLLHQPAFEERTLKWLYDRSVRRLNEDTRAVLRVAGRVTLDIFPLSLAAAALSGDNLEPRSREALRKLVREGLLLVTEEGWQFTHVLPYHFSRGDGALDEGVLEGLAAWAMVEFKLGIESFSRSLDSAKARRAARHALAILECGSLNMKPELLIPMLSALPEYSVGLREVALHLTQGLYDHSKRAFEQGRTELKPKVGNLANSLATCLSKSGRRTDALAPAQEAADIYRELARQNPDAFKPDLAMSLNNLANHLSVLGRRTDALAPAQEAVDIGRALARQNPDAFQPALAASLNNLANHLSELGQRTDALAPAQEAVDIRRALARQNPDAFKPDLAMSLNNLALRLSGLGRRTDALAPAQEAVDIGRALARQNPDAFQPALAASLNNLANHLSELGQRTDALAPAQEAVDIRRALARQNPDAFKPDLAMSLNTLANRLSALGRRTDALAPAQEAVDIYRELARQNPDAFQPALAASLNNLANHLSELGQRTDALAPAQEAVDIRRALARQNPDAFKPDLAMSLNILALRLSGLGRRTDALAPAQEAVDIYRELARQNPDAFKPDLAMSLNNLANHLSDLGRRTDALAPAQEAVDIRRALARQNPDAFKPDLAMSLNNLALRLSGLGRRTDALAPAQEAVDIGRALARQNPDAFQPALAASLNNLANHLSELGQRTDALAPAQEAVDIRRALARQNPDAFKPDLAMSLNNLALRLSGLGRRTDALAPAQEAVDIRRALARQNPDAFKPDLATSLGTISQALAGLGRHTEATVALAEAVHTLQPQFDKLPEVHTTLMQYLLQRYAEAAKAANIEPDKALVARADEIHQLEVYCSAPDCRRASKAASQQSTALAPNNPQARLTKDTPP